MNLSHFSCELQVQRNSTKPHCLSLLFLGESRIAVASVVER